MALDRGNPGDMSALDTTESEAVDDSGSNRSYSAGLAPSCMFWLMVVGLGLIAITVVIWGVSNFNRI